MRLHTEIFPEQQCLVFEMLANQDWLSHFYLAGGTALALQIAHRQSIDFDFFTKAAFNTAEIVQALRVLGKFELFDQTGDTLNGSLNDVKISYFRYDYPLLKGFHTHKKISIANMLDIALMKLEAIAGRGNKKDFIDLYFLLRHFSLSELFQKYPQKYGLEISNHYHLLKSLIYFEDAEKQPMPTMQTQVTWDEIKKRIVFEVTKVQRENTMPAS